MDIKLNNLTEYDLTFNTELIQTSIDEISSTGGGKLIIPSGTYHIKTIFLKSNVCLYLEKGSELIGSTDIKDYGYSSLELKYSCSVGNVVPSHYYGLIIIEKAFNASICGEGVINGMGKYQEYFPNKDDPSNSRPFLVMLFLSKDFYIEGVTLKDSGMYAFYSMSSDNVHVNGIKIRTLDSINGDGVDFDGGKNILVENCDIESSDDSVSTKTYTNYPIQNVLVRNCRMRSNWAAVRVGTESASDMENIVVEDCEFVDCRDGIKIQMCGPANYRHITFNNIKMSNVIRPFFITASKFRLSVDEGEIMPESGVMEYLSFNNIDIRETNKILYFQNNHQKGMYEQKALFLSGYYNNFISHVDFNNINIHLIRNHEGPIRYDIPELVDVFEQYPEISHIEGELPSSFFYFRNINDLSLSNIKLHLEGDDNRPYIFFNNVKAKLKDIQYDSSKDLIHQYKSSIEGNYPLINIQEDTLDEVYSNMNEYLNYVKSYIPLISFLEKSPKSFEVNLDEFRVKENGEYIVFIPKLMGEANIKVGEKIVATHRYAKNYKYSYAYAFKAYMEVGDKLEIQFLNKDDMLGHHGIISPLYGVSYSPYIKLLKL